MKYINPGLTYSGWGTFSKLKEGVQKLKKAGDSICIYQNELNRACFQHDAANEDWKIYQEEQFSIKHYVIKYLTLLNTQNMMDIKKVLLQWFINFFNKRSSGDAAILTGKSAIKSEILINQQLTEELDK